MAKLRPFVVMAACVTRLAAVEPITLCGILNHPSDYLNRQVAVRGLVVHYLHSGYLVASPACEGLRDSSVLLDLDWRDYYAAAGRSGVYLPVMLEGKLEMSDRYIPHAKPGPHLFFVATKVRYEPAKK